MYHPLDEAFTKLLKVGAGIKNKGNDKQTVITLKSL